MRTLLFSMISVAGVSLVATSEASAQGYRYVYPPATSYRIVRPAPTYRVVRQAPRFFGRHGTTYYTRPYPSSSAYGYVEHDTTRPNWSFDYDAWIAHNF